jgi:hypothetical protein
MSGTRDVATKLVQKLLSEHPAACRRCGGVGLVITDGSSGEWGDCPECVSMMRDPLDTDVELDIRPQDEDEDGPGAYYSTVSDAFVAGWYLDYPDSFWISARDDLPTQILLWSVENTKDWSDSQKATWPYDPRLLPIVLGDGVDPNWVKPELEETLTS